MNSRTERLLKIKKELENSFNCLIDSFGLHGEDGICISDIEFTLTEYDAKLYELYELLKN